MPHRIRVYYRTARTHRFALIDASQREELPAHWAQHVIAPRFLGQDTDRCPALIDLQALHKDECAEFCAALDQQTQAREECQASLLIAAPVDAAVLASCLRDRIAIQMAPGDDRPKQFRFFDPGTFLQLPALLGDDGMVWLMGMMSSVLVPWAGQWTLYERPVSHEVFALTSTHLQSLLRLGVVNRVAAMDEQPPIDAASWVRQCQAIDAHVHRASTQHGMTSRDDLIAFARHTIDHHPRIAEHPRMRALLASLRTAQPEDELDYRELSGQLHANDWAEMARELRQQDPQEARTS